MFGDGEFKPLVDWVQSELNIDLVTCATNSHVPRAENTIRFVKERLRAIQSETPFEGFTNKMLKRVDVLINLFKKCIQ